VGCDSEVCLSVVESVVIDVVDDHAGRDFDYVAVHEVGEVRFFIAGRAGPLGIICAGGLVFGGVPFVVGRNEKGGDVKSYFDECEPFFHCATGGRQGPSGIRRYRRPPIIGSTCAFDSKLRSFLALRHGVSNFRRGS